MAKILPATALIAAALAFSSFVTVAYGNKDYLTVVGKVYCDPCRVMFETRLSTNIAGAKVQLECNDRVSNQLTYSQVAVTDKDGKYAIPVVGDHEDDVCDITVTHSPDPECSETMEGVPGSKPLLSSNAGVVEPVRFASPLGFMTKKESPECPQVLREIGWIGID